MGLLEHASNLRYHKAVEDYSRHMGKVNVARSGVPGATAAAVARAASHAETSPESPAAGQPAPQPEPGLVKSALITVAKGAQTMIGAEMALSAPLAKIPFPGLPALRVLDVDVGLPHAHNHPPNVTPPSPVPIPLPSMGPVIPIPILSGASTVMINGSPAARCGDMGLAIFCGGFFPMFEVFLGSSNVWFESARASRVGVDITKHCTFSAPKPSDPPLGPMVGATIPPVSPNVMIGGVPMPSLFSMAVAQAFKAVFKVGGAVFRKATAKSYVNKLLKQGALVLDNNANLAGWTDDMMKDLMKMASSRTGRQILKRIEKSGKTVTMIPYTGWFPRPHGWSFEPHNAWASAASDDGVMDVATGLKMPGSDATVCHNPSMWSNHAGGGYPGAPAKTTSDGILAHEMNHAANATEGGMRADGVSKAHGWDQRWQNFEEYNTVAQENGHRLENGLPTRADYTSPFP